MRTARHVLKVLVVQANRTKKQLSYCGPSITEPPDACCGHLSPAPWYRLAPGSAAINTRAESCCNQETGSVSGQRLIHFDGLGAFVHRFALVGESLMAAELSGLREAAVAALAPDGQTKRDTQRTDHYESWRRAQNSPHGPERSSSSTAGTLKELQIKSQDLH
ncbi:hypothetical protein GOODEAATRI_022738 [Goodea atripinnis]|uniref:Uncharacterized protein n=1 Tax=Goodea atripinnis TaxID=208336 RepID=A0ABV0MUI4_9TELE